MEDARRGHPATTLEHFAAANGLEYRNVEQAGAFLSTLPTWPDYLFNVCRGTLPSGRYGQVAHELFEVKAHNNSVHAAGEFFDVKVTYTIRHQVNGADMAARRDEPFAGHSVWIPTTTVHVRVPESNQLPLLGIARSSSFTGRGDMELDTLGLPGYRVLQGAEAAQFVALAADAVRPILVTRSDAHVSLRVRYGLVALTVNGYRSDDADLRHLLSCADQIATALSGFVAPAADLPFATYGPAVGMVTPYSQVAQQLGMHDEDVSYLLAIAPRCPIPGIPAGVLAGYLPGTSTPCRLVWFEQGGRTVGSVRGGVVLPAAPGATTPVGGTLHEATGMYVEVVDGLVACWRKQRSFGTLEAPELIAAATATLRASGLATI